MPNSDHGAKVKGYWTRTADQWDDLYDSKSAFGRWFNRVFRKGMFLRVDLAKKTCLSTKAETVLDIGSGSGRPATVLVKSGVPHVTGIDVAPSMVQLAEKLVANEGIQDKCDFRVESFGDVAYDADFDVVIALGVLDYVESPVPFVEKMKKAAKKAIVFSAPQPTLVRSPLRKIRYTARGCPIRFYTRNKLRMIMNEAGFSDENIEIVPLTNAGYGVVGYINGSKS